MANHKQTSHCRSDIYNILCNEIYVVSKSQLMFSGYLIMLSNASITQQIKIPEFSRICTLEFYYKAVFFTPLWC